MIFFKVMSLIMINIFYIQYDIYFYYPNPSSFFLRLFNLNPSNFI